VLCVEGHKRQSQRFLFLTSEAAHVLLQITDTTILYLKEKSKIRSRCRSDFDSWGGMLSPVDYQGSLGSILTKLSSFGRSCSVIFGKDVG
jgi:hypothetical protein